MNRNDSSADERDLERRARRRVGMKMGLAIHALVYVLVNLGLVAINAYTGGANWAVFPLLGWGLGLAIHAVIVFFALEGDGWRRRMIERETERLRQGR